MYCFCLRNSVFVTQVCAKVCDEDVGFSATLLSAHAGEAAACNFIRCCIVNVFRSHRCGLITSQMLCAVCCRCMEEPSCCSWCATFTTGFTCCTAVQVCAFALLVRVLFGALTTICSADAYRHAAAATTSSNVPVVCAAALIKISTKILFSKLIVPTTTPAA
jgi:hypothetical protein